MARVPEIAYAALGTRLGLVPSRPQRVMIALYRAWVRVKFTPMRFVHAVRRWRYERRK